jgi:hypothetical protein
MAQPKSRVNEEKLLNDLFVLLEFTDSFKEFVAGMGEDARLILLTEIKRYYGD